MDAYFSLLVVVGYLVMTVIFLAALLLYIFSLPTKLRVHAPLADGLPGSGAESEHPVRSEMEKKNVAKGVGSNSQSAE